MVFEIKENGIMQQKCMVHANEYKMWSCHVLIFSLDLQQTKTALKLIKNPMTYNASRNPQVNDVVIVILDSRASMNFMMQLTHRSIGSQHMNCWIDCYGQKWDGYFEYDCHIREGI